MTPAAPVAALVASSLEAVGIAGYLAVGALLLRFVVRWCREAVDPTSSSSGPPGLASPSAGGTTTGQRADPPRSSGAAPR